MKILFFFLALSPSVFAEGESLPANDISTAIVKDIDMGCGYADYVFGQYLGSVIIQKSKLNYAVRGVQGETGRRFVLYTDNSWILTLEFFDRKDSNKDISCIVAKGTEENAYEAVNNYPIKALPELNFPEFSDRSLLVQKFRLPGEKVITNPRMYIPRVKIPKLPKVKDFQPDFGY